jgi:hypothetical protein
MALTRLPDWQGRLSGFLCERQHEPFRYGRWDCFLFVCSAICAITEVDPAAPFRGTYSSRAECRLRMVAYCGSASVRAVAESLFAGDYGMPETIPFRAHRGDVALIKRSRDFSLGLVALNGIEIVALSAHGLCRLPLSAAVRAWHV